jgi:hypothetical protein
MKWVKWRRAQVGARREAAATQRESESPLNASMKAERFELEARRARHRGFTGVGKGDQRAISGVEPEYVLANPEQRYSRMQRGRSF